MMQHLLSTDSPGSPAAATTGKTHQCGSRLAALIILFAACCAGFCGVRGFDSVRAADPVPTATEQFNAATRGFGAVKANARFYGEPGKRSSWTAFETEDAAHAALFASKRVTDLTGFGDIKPAAPLPTSAATRLELPGAGFWLLGVQDATVHEIFARSAAELEQLAATAGAKDWKPAQTGKHPLWLDGFDNFGTAIWLGGGGDQYNLPKDFEWLKQRKLAMCTLSPNATRFVGPGVADTSIYDWHTKMAAEYGIPYRALFFPARPKWLWNITPLPHVTPAPNFIAYPSMQHAELQVYSSYEPIPASDRYDRDYRRFLADYLKNDPNFMGWHGCTEIPDAGILELAAVAGMPVTKALWHSYLVNELGLDLEDAGQLYKGAPGAYQKWEELEVPLPQDFLGWSKQTCTDLLGRWLTKPDIEQKGETEKWFDPATADTGWTESDCNDPLILMYTPQGRRKDDKQRPDFWMKRTFTLSPEALAQAKFLHIGRGAWHGNFTPQFNVWINGKAAKPTSRDVRGDFSQCYDMAGLLQPGENKIVLNTHGTPVSGYCFLGPVPLREYPNMSEQENRLWFDGTNFDAWLRVRAVEKMLQAQRTAEPDRPLKLMAMINLLDLTIPLCEKYGAYQHDTGGAGGYWCPMTGARLSRTHGLPWSCEQGGPPKTMEDFRKSTTFYVMYGNDAADLVFAVAHYSEKPDVAKWFDENLELIRCVGKMRLPLPPVGVLRSSRATRLGFDTPWTWDVGRGGVQAVGRNFAYAEVPDILNKSIDQFKVLMDDGTVLMTDDEVAGLERYVRQGGVFIAQHHTGKHSPAKANAWPISRLTGLQVVNDKEVSGDLVFSETQNIWPTLRGKKIRGWGRVMDYLNRDVTGNSLQLRATDPGVEVIARWEGKGIPAGQGDVALAVRRIGKGMVITLGSTFWRHTGDLGGIYKSDSGSDSVLDELLKSLAVPRDSWTGWSGLWAELWQSKNGVYDLYPIARMEPRKEEQEVRNGTVSLRRDAPVAELTEVSTLDHRKVPVKWENGRVTLPEASYEKMQTRVYIAPRADAERAALDWFRTQAEIWRALPVLPDLQKPARIEQSADMLPLAEGWKMHHGDLPDESWTAAGFAGAGWQEVKLGALATMGIPETAKAQLSKTVEIPADWKEKDVQLVFDAEHWFWGIQPQAQLWVNGKPAPVKQPLLPAAQPSFSFPLSAEEVAAGKLTIAIAIDGTVLPKKKKPKPNGITGLFYLQARERPIKSEPLNGPWQAGVAFNELTPVKTGEAAKFTYLETRFTLPAEWPGKRIFLGSADVLGWLVLNGKVIDTPSWMHELDISGLVHKDGKENVLRWIPTGHQLPGWNNLIKTKVPAANLLWYR